MLLRGVHHNENMHHRADATDYHLTDAQFSTVAIIDDSAVVQERVTYSAYGRARHHWLPDVDGDGDADATDTGIISTIAGGTENAIGEDDYRAEADLDRDGEVDSTDTGIATTFGAKAALRYGDLTSPGTPSGSPPGSGVDNIIGFDGYVFNVECDLYHVRFRWYSPELGRWLERDPAGYVDGLNAHLAFRSNPRQYNDSMGLAAITWTFTLFCEDKPTGCSHWKLETRQISVSRKVTLPAPPLIELGAEIGSLFADSALTTLSDAGELWDRYHTYPGSLTGVTCVCGWRKYVEYCERCYCQKSELVHAPEKEGLWPFGWRDVGPAFWTEAECEYRTEGPPVYTYGILYQAHRGYGCTCPHPESVVASIEDAIQMGKVPEKYLTKAQSLIDKFASNDCIKTEWKAKWKKYR